MPSRDNVRSRWGWGSGIKWWGLWGWGWGSWGRGSRVRVGRSQGRGLWSGVGGPAWQQQWWHVHDSMRPSWLEAALGLKRNVHWPRDEKKQLRCLYLGAHFHNCFLAAESNAVNWPSSSVFPRHRLERAMSDHSGSLYIRGIKYLPADVCTALSGVLNLHLRLAGANNRETLRGVIQASPFLVFVWSSMQKISLLYWSEWNKVWSDTPSWYAPKICPCLSLIQVMSFATLFSLQQQSGEPSGALIALVDLLLDID